MHADQCASCMEKHLRVRWTWTLALGLTLISAVLRVITASRILLDIRISCLSFCLPNATAPLVTIITCLPEFCSSEHFDTKNTFSGSMPQGFHAHYLFDYRRQATKCNATLVFACYYSTAKFDYYRFGIFELTARSEQFVLRRLKCQLKKFPSFTNLSASTEMIWNDSGLLFQTDFCFLHNRLHVGFK